MRDTQHGYTHGNGALADFPDTGVTNGQLAPGNTAKLGAWAVVVAVILLPMFF